MQHKISWMCADIPTIIPQGNAYLSVSYKLMTSVTSVMLTYWFVYSR